MTFLEIIDEQNYVDEKSRNLIVNLLELAANIEKVDIDNTELAITFVDKEEIKNINREYRGIDRPTDVISFALNDEVEGELEIIGGNQIDYLGDIIICVDVAKEQAKEYNHSYERELGFLALHGFLHLLGYDHMTEEDEKEMFGKQDYILNEYGLLR
ncbi:rRNA maturation RNase YbeY [Gemella sp. GH3]|nr:MULTISPECIES: rRNA maturation RNase YbeY [unclassified Gemella]MBF0713180.1 rRNA maturation RNase YbeY [Gemella sp. GH3.1]NYS50132.1 rRNA maturation RNase YbeY [Gemella sp. GH3]